MLTMSQINDIRDLSRKRYRISKISSLTGMDRKTVRKHLKQDDFSPEPPVVKTRKSIVTPYIDTITGWLEEDQKHWSKQHHTAKRIHERPRDEYGFTGSYDSVQKFVQKIRKNIQTKGTQELIWEPGCAQVDFGKADFYEDTDCVRRKYLTVSSADPELGTGVRRAVDHVRRPASRMTRSATKTGGEIRPLLTCQPVSVIK